MLQSRHPEQASEMNQNILFLGAFLLSSAFSLILILKIDFSKNLKQDLSKPKQKSAIDSELYNTELADKLFDEVRILCLVMTYSENHKTKAVHVKETWGKQCNKLVFISDVHDDEIGAVTLPSAGRQFLWGKTKMAFKYAYDHYFDDAEWFIKADDDSFLIGENIRYMLYQYHHQTSLYFGHRYAVESIDEGYMAGGGYILSKAAVKKFVTQIMWNATLCRTEEDGEEDFEMGACLRHNAILVDERDERKQKRFFPMGFEFEHLKKQKDPDFWYDQSQYYETALGSLKCCSNKPVEFHYVGPEEMYLIQYLTRNVYPFGLVQNVTEELPRKLRLEEILSASDAESSSVNFHSHRNVHNIDSNELYKR